MRADKAGAGGSGLHQVGRALARGPTWEPPALAASGVPEVAPLPGGLKQEPQGPALSLRAGAPAWMETLLPSLPQEVRLDAGDLGLFEHHVLGQGLPSGWSSEHRQMKEPVVHFLVTKVRA